MTTSTPSTLVSTAILASSIEQRVCVSTRAWRFSPEMAWQSARLCGEARGEVSSRYSTPKASNSVAIWIFSSREKKALTNCSPSRRVD